MSPPVLAPAACDHLVKLLGTLGSAHAGERAAAGLKAHQFIKRLGLTWGWLEIVAVCAADAARIRPKKRGLIATLLRWEGGPTEKQLDWLARIYERVS